MKISVIVPVYNVEQYLPKCIDSILNQIYPIYELILVNDGSKDASLSICYEYQRTNSKVKVYTQENKGVGAARNLGLDVAQGDFVIFIDSDDIIDINMLHSMIYADPDIGCSICSYLIYNESNNLNRIISYKESGIYSLENFIKNWDQLRKTSILNNIGTKLYRLEIIKKQNIRFSTIYSICEDIKFCIEYLSFVKNIKYVNEPYYVYYKRSNNSLMNSYKLRCFEAKLELHNVIYKMMLENKVYKENLESFYKMIMEDAFFVILNEIKFKNYSKESEKIIKTLQDSIYVKQAKKLISNMSMKERIRNYLIWNVNPKYIFYFFTIIY